MMDEAQTIAMAATGKECSCGKGQCVTCILAGEIRRRDADIIKLKAELAEAKAEAAQWKANHDNQVTIKRAVLDRPDLAERAKLVQALTAERDSANADADLLGRYIYHMTKDYTDTSCENADVALADILARPTAAARVKGGAS